MSEIDSAARRELAPTGILRVAIALSPAPSPFFATRDPASGEPSGVTVLLAHALAAWVDLPVSLVIYPNSGEITARADLGEWDVTFMPADAERAKQVAFGPAYALVESTFLAAPGRNLHDYADVDRPGMRVAAIANTATARSAARALSHAALVPYESVDATVAALQAGQADALALSRGALERLALELPGARVLDGRFHAAGVAVAVPRGRPAALGLVSAFIEAAKASGEIRRAFDAAGLADAVVAPAGATQIGSRDGGNALQNKGFKVP